MPRWKGPGRKFFESLLVIVSMGSYFTLDEVLEGMEVENMYMYLDVPGS